MRQRFIQSFPTSKDIQTALDNKELGKPYVALSREEPSIDWNTKVIDYTGMPLTFEIISGGTIGLIGKYNTITNYEYQINDGEIVTGQAAGNVYTNISLNAGDVIKIRGFLNGQNGGLSVNPDADLVFNIYGNVASLGSALVDLGLAGKHVINAENLVMLDHGFKYSGLFKGCTDLITAPELPLTTLLYGFYQQMFYGCTSLTKAPKLPATKLVDSCYDSMFRGCTSLTTAPELPATKLASYCYRNMFNGCTSLTQAPELPASELVNFCYDSMFRGCTNLNYVKAMFATTPGSSYTSNWLYGVASSGKFVKNPEATWDTDETFARGSSTVPTNWTVENAKI